jgi:Zn-dependent protease with chaperone function
MRDHFFYVALGAICAAAATETAVAWAHLHWIAAQLGRPDCPASSLRQAARRTQLSLIFIITNGTLALSSLALVTAAIRPPLSQSPWAPLAAATILVLLKLIFSLAESLSNPVTGSLPSLILRLLRRGSADWAVSALPAALVGWGLGLWSMPWWLVAAAGWLLYCLALEITPPQTRRLIPVADAAKSTEFDQIMARSGLGNLTVWGAEDSQPNSKPNARAEGIGPFRRVVVNIALIDLLSPKDAAAIVGHEAGHLHYRHREMFLIWRIALGLAALAAASLLDPVMPPPGVIGILILASPCLALLTHPAEAALIHHWELQADKHSAHLVGASTFKQALTHIFAAHGIIAAPYRPYAWFHSSHPSPAKRLQRLT